MNFGGYGGDIHGPPYTFCLLLKKRKSTRAWHIHKSNSTLFWFKQFFPRMNNKKIMKMWPQGATLLFLYEVSIVVLIDFMAILLTPAIFLIQIDNTNVYLINFHSKKNIQMYFHKSWIFKVSNQSESFIIHHNVFK